jgi:hypothetical protein
MLTWGGGVIRLFNAKFINEYHFNNIAKINLKNFVLNHIDKNKKLTFFKKNDIFYVMKVTLLSNAFLKSH